MYLYICIFAENITKPFALNHPVIYEEVNHPLTRLGHQEYRPAHAQTPLLHSVTGSLCDESSTPTMIGFLYQTFSSDHLFDESYKNFDFSF